jgi:nitroreductase
MPPMKVRDFMLRDLVKKNRSYRRFHEDVPIERGTLEALVELARLSASAGNKQPLKYILSCDTETNKLIYPQLAWAAYLKDWEGPPEGERPTAYIVILRDNEIGDPMQCDHGIAAQSILLGAVEKGLGGCIIASVRRNNLEKIFTIPPNCEILCVIALGTPKERVIIETVGPSGDIRYWRDEEGVHHVPKRPLEEIIIT